jgi:hypothetical protein
MSQSMSQSMTDSIHLRVADLDRDPDNNGVELYWDRPEPQWPKDAQGNLAMYTRALDLQGLLAESNT